MEIHGHRLLDGGASAFGYAILDTIRDLGIHANRAFDWCSGYGGVGYRILTAGLCDHLVLGDINPDALALARQTATDNDLDNVTIYETDCLDQIPEHERWDLVVGNPPHFDADLDTYLTLPGISKQWPVQFFHERIWRDDGWALHRRFFQSIGDHLTEDGTIILCETWTGATPETFAPMIRDNGYTYEVREGVGDTFHLIVRRA